MGKHELTASKTIQASPRKVWKAVADVAEIVRWFPNCRAASLHGAPKPGVGVTRILELDVQGRLVRSEQEITRFEPESRFAWKHVSDTVDGKSFELLEDPGLDFSITPVDGGSRIDVTAEWVLKGFKAKLAGPLVRRVVADQAERVLERLREHVEAAKAVPPKGV